MAWPHHEGDLVQIHPGRDTGSMFQVRLTATRNPETKPNQRATRLSQFSSPLYSKIEPVRACCRFLVAEFPVTQVHVGGNLSPGKVLQYPLPSSSSHRLPGD